MSEFYSGVLEICKLIFWKYLRKIKDIQNASNNKNGFVRIMHLKQKWTSQNELVRENSWLNFMFMWVIMFQNKYY
jgi:hypothetical protein